MTAWVYLAFGLVAGVALGDAPVNVAVAAGAMWLAAWLLGLYEGVRYRRTR